MDHLYLYLIAFIGGAVSVLTPCVLPLLPSILAFSSTEGRRRIWGIVLGIEFSFIGLSLLLSGLLEATGLPPDSLEKLAGTLLVIFGLTLIIPALDARFQRAMSAVVSRIPQKRGAGGDGFVGGLAAGGTLGLVWAPCAGPILASVTVAANTDGFTTRTVAVALVYGLGMAGPLAAVLFGGRRLGRWLIDKLGGGRRVLAPMGALLVLTGVVIFSGQFTKVNERVAAAVNLTSTPIAALEDRAIRQASDTKVSAAAAAGDLPGAAELEANGYPSSDDGELHDLGPAPDFAGVNKWHNTPGGKPLDMESLRGKVVLIDFWTYSCINCLRTLPYIREWHDTYADDGLVIVGVHTPEFAFEKDEGNVAGAIDDLDIEYPVATDPDFDTWENYHNRYWPAKYLIDRDGNVRFVHYGEGEYDVTEQRIRDLLELEPKEDEAREEEPVFHAGARTPETYLGYSRISGEQYRSSLEGRIDLDQDRMVTYAPPRPSAPDAGLGLDEFAFSGGWKVEDERAIAGDDAQLLLHYQGKDVFLVIGPPDRGGTGKVTVTDSGSGGTDTTLEIDKYQLYDLRRSEESTDGLLTINATPGVSMYAFTFG